jgi:hypothetical protein
MTSLLNFIKNLPIGSKVIRGDTQTDRQTGDLISLTFLFKGSRLKIQLINVKMTLDIIHDKLSIVGKIYFQLLIQRNGEICF